MGNGDHQRYVASKRRYDISSGGNTIAPVRQMEEGREGRDDISGGAMPNETIRNVRLHKKI